MTFVVLESCIQCKYTDCVEVCPVDCFHAGPNFMVIDPEECIDCALCESECPVSAIKPEDELTDAEQVFLGLNAELSQIWPVLTKSVSPLPDAELWRAKTDKLAHLVRE